MEIKGYNKRILLKAILVIIPISILIYDYTASKLYTFEQSRIASFMILALLLIATTQCYRNRRYLHLREIKYVVLFFILSFPAYLFSSFISLESYVRYFSLIAFVPLGFMSGLIWGHHHAFVKNQDKDRLITIFLLPAFLAAGMIASNTIFAPYYDETMRDYIFGIVIFLPLVLYYKKNFWPVFILTIAAYICIISSKRTGMLCVASVISFLALVKMGNREVRSSKYITTAILALIVFLVAYKYLPDITPHWANSIERFNNMNDESNEMRMLKYAWVIDGIKSSNIFTLLFGHGCFAAVQLLGTPVHNDWLEISFDYGVIPLTCIFILILSLLIRVFKTMKKIFSSSMILLATLVIFIITTMGNCMFTTPVDVFVLMFTLGFASSNITINTAYNI